MISVYVNISIAVAALEEFDCSKELFAALRKAKSNPALLPKEEGVFPLACVDAHVSRGGFG